MPHLNSMPMHQGRQLPLFTLREIDLPEIKSWEVNDDYFLVMRVKMTGKREQGVSDDSQDQGKLEGEFEVHSVKALGYEPVNVEKLKDQEWQQALAEAYGS